MRDAGRPDCRTDRRGRLKVGFPSAATARTGDVIDLTEHAAQVDPTTSLEHLHHALHLTELLEQRVDLLNAFQFALWFLGAINVTGAARNALLTAGIEDLRVAALFGRHRANQRLDLAHPLFGLGLVDLILEAAQARDQIQQLADWAHLLDLLHLRQEVL